MACDQLDKPFWVRQYFISPVAQTTEGGGAECCIQYKIHISTPKLEPEKPSVPGETAQVRRSPTPPSSLRVRLRVGKHFLFPQVLFPCFSAPSGCI